MQKYYFDTAATLFMNSIMRDELSRILNPNAVGPWGNPNSLHAFGRRTKKRIRDAKEQILHTINGRKGSVHFCASGSSGNALVVGSECKGPGDLICSEVDHKSIYQFRRKYGGTVNVDKTGKIDLDDLKRKVTEHTRLLTCTLVNNEIGTLQPVRDLLPYKKDALLLVDAVQALGKIPVDVEELGCDFLTLSAHKIGGPQGIGCIWVRNGVELQAPYLGTPNLLGIVGFDIATRFLFTDKNVVSKLWEIENTFLDVLEENKIEFSINGNSEDRVPGYLNLALPVDATTLLLDLMQLGVSASVGSACSSGEAKPSHVLEAIGLDEDTIRRSVRFTFHYDHDLKHIKEGAEIVVKAIQNIRGEHVSGSQRDQVTKTQEGILAT